MGYDPQFSKLQPGIYLLAEIVSDLLSNNIYCLDFLSGDSLFKRRLSNTSRKERHYYLIPRGWPGTAYALSLSASNFLSEKIGSWLDKKGLKSRIKRSIRDTAVTKR
jgi:CelD/BcsL family acetyltransferase involved in cellulose biosynthesis